MAKDWHLLSDREKIEIIQNIRKNSEKGITKDFKSKNKDNEKISRVAIPLDRPKAGEKILKGKDKSSEKKENLVLQKAKKKKVKKNSSEAENNDTKYVEKTHDIIYVSKEQLDEPGLRESVMKLFKSPVKTIVISFAFLIIIGAILLSFPFASASGQWTSFFKSLFTSTSAVCVTGLVLVDTGTYWSAFGHVIIISLIQLGGIGLLTIVAAFFRLTKQKVSMNTIRSLQETFGSESLEQVFDLLRFVLRFTFSCELIGGLIISLAYLKYMPVADAFYRGMFQGISAFCNAGFDVMGSQYGEFASLTGINNDPIVLLTTALLLTMGGLGFIVWVDIFDAVKEKRKLKLHSKLVLSVTLGILVIGTILIAAFEWNNMSELAMGTLPDYQKPLAAFFQVATLRTAGFNSINQSTLYQVSMFIGIIIMFIGASPVSTGGGLKTTTFATILADVKANIQGKKNIVIQKRSLNNKLVSKAMVLFVLFVSVAVIAVGLILGIERSKVQAGQFTSLDIMYEVISALCTVGVTSIQTNKLDSISQLVLIICMFIGRVGPFSIALLVSFKKQEGDDEEIFAEGVSYVG